MNFRNPARYSGFGEGERVKRSGKFRNLAGKQEYGGRGGWGGISMGGSANSVISHENEMSGKGRAGKRERGRKRGGKSTIGNSISVISQENMKS
ncbi:MAG: hypothetical protein IJS32_02190, partial [Kiritimatiellae bacterium]|nr:hypothetical protein [Kiritimatiellia bacterium]